MLEQKLEQKYGGKALKMLEKMSGYKLGQGVGKYNQGILNPIEQVAVVDKGGLGYSKPDKPSILKKSDDIDMDIHKQEDARKQEQESQQKKSKMDDEERAFIDLLNERRRQGGHLKSKRDFKTTIAEMETQMNTTVQVGGKLNIIDMTRPHPRSFQPAEKKA